MKTVNMHEAKTHLSKLVEDAVRGEPFIIARAGKPLVKVVMIEAEAPRRTGFLKGQVDLPEDFDTMFEGEIAALFAGPDSATLDNASAVGGASGAASASDGKDLGGKGAGGKGQGAA